MNLLILYDLLHGLTEEKEYLEATMLETDDLAQQDDLEQRLLQIAPLLAEICGEILARELRGARLTGTAPGFEAHLHRVLKAYSCMGLVRGKEAEIRRTA